MSFKQKIYSNKSQEEVSAENSGAWLVSFADLLSLILTFFVLVYSISEIPEKKWTEYSSSIVEFITGNKFKPLDNSLQVSEKSNSIKLKTKPASELGYLKTIIDDKFSTLPYATPIVVIDGSHLIINFKNNNLNEISSILLESSNLLHKISNKLMVSYELTDKKKSFQDSNFIARKITEYGYEYKVLIEVFYDYENSNNLTDSFLKIIIFNDENFI